MPNLTNCSAGAREISPTAGLCPHGATKSRQASNRPQMTAVRSVIVVMVATAAGCSTMADLEDGEPEFSATYPQSDPAAVQECVKARIMRERAGTVPPATIREPDRVVLLNHLEGHFGTTMGLLWVAHFYPERVEVFGKPHIGGHHGDEVPELARKCAGNNAAA